MEAIPIIDKELDIRTLIRQELESVLDERLKNLATKEDIKRVQDQLDAHQKAIAAHDGRLDTQDKRMAEAENDFAQFSKAFKADTREIKESALKAIERMDTRDQQYHDRLKEHSERIAANEQTGRQHSNALTDIERDLGDVRTRFAQGFEALSKAVLGDKETGRAGIITDLGNVKKEIGDQHAERAREFKTLSDGLTPLVTEYQTREAKRRRNREVRHTIFAAAKTPQGLAVASLLGLTVLRFVAVLNPDFSPIADQFGHFILRFVGLGDS